MSRLIDLTGQKFGKLTVIERVDGSGSVRWKCVCDCGKETVVRASNLKSGSVKSCGCLRKIPPNATHMESNTPLNRMWRSMLYRCEKPSYFAYKYYGARGISVCEEWHDFKTFKEWVVATKPEGNYTLDRIDNFKDYCPQNCRWASAEEQANNRRSNVVINYRGETHNLTEWCNILGLDYKRVHNRLHKLGWSFEKAISESVEVKKRNKGERNKNG